MEKQKLIYVESKALFSPSEVSDKAIVFIKDTKEIWTHGVYFSCSGTWATPITLSLTGDTTGSVSIDGSGNASIATTTLRLSASSYPTDANNAVSTAYHNISYYRANSDTSNLFPVTNNANAILSLNVHDYSYTHLLGFSSDGNIYHRKRSAGTWDTSWKTILNSSNYTNFHHTFASLTNKPTTLSGYGITDCIPIINVGNVTTDTDLSTLGMTTTGAKLSVSRTNNANVPSWGYGYSNYLIFRSTLDTYSGIATDLGSGMVTFIGGRNLETTANNVPNWWFRIKGASGTTYDLNSFLTTINNLGHTYLKRVGGTMTGSIVLTTDAAYINDTTSGYSIYGSVTSSNTGIGTSGLGTIFAGTPAINMVLRTSGDNLYHYNHSKSARYLILDTNNYSTYALPLSGGTMKGALNFANNTWNKVGDDAYMGDCNVAGMIGIKGSNAATPGFVMYNNSGTRLGKLYASGTSLYWSDAKILTASGTSKLFVMGDGSLYSDTVSYTTWDKTTTSGIAWFPIASIINPDLGSALFIVRAYAHSSIIFTVTSGHSTGNINVLAGGGDYNAGFAYIMGVRLMGDFVELGLNAAATNVNIVVKVLLPTFTHCLKSSLVESTSTTTPYAQYELNTKGNNFNFGIVSSKFTGNLIGNADTASNISTVNPILALPFEENTIQVVSNPNGALAELLGAAAAITHAIRFNWYDTAYEIGNVRGGAANSLGFGVTYGNNNLCLLVKTNGTYSPYGFIGSLSGNASTASKWKDARTITLTGDVTGSVSLDGSSNVTLTTATSGTGTTSFLKCLDKRNSYPALIVTSGGKVGAAFMSASKLGLSDGSYYDAIILRGYEDHTGGNENALLFSKNTSSVYHSQYAFGSTTTWGTMYKFLDSGNYTNYTINHTKSGINNTGFVGVVNGNNLYNHSELSFARFAPTDATPSYELIAELTNYNTGANTGYITYGISGFMWSHRAGVCKNSSAYPITAIVSIGPSTYSRIRVPVTTGVLVPFIVKYNDKYYLALRQLSSSTAFYFMGQKLHLLTTTIKVTDASLIEEIKGPETETSTAMYYYNNGTPQEYLHAGNYSSYALPLTGGRLTGNITVPSAFINTGDATLKFYSGEITDAKSDGNICLLTSIDGTDGLSHVYPTQLGGRCNLVLLPRGGQVYIGINPDGGNTSYKLYVNGGIHASSLISDNVGIGTSSPSEKLLVAGNAIIGGNAIVGTDSTNSSLTIKSKNSGGVAYLHFDNGLYSTSEHWKGYIAVSGWGDPSMKTEGYGLPGKDQAVHGMIFKLPRTDMGGYSFRNGSNQDIGYLDRNGKLTVKSSYIVSGGTSSQFLKADGSLDSTSYLPTAGGTLGSTSATQTELWLKSSTTTLRLVAHSSTTFNYIQSGNADFNGNTPLQITGYNGTVGSDLYLKFNNIYCRSGNYANIDSGNYSNYAIKVDGTNGTADGVSALLNKLTTGTATPVDADYYICQYAGGGTTTTSYVRRPISALYTYIKSKLSLNPDERFIYATSATSNQYGTTEATGSSSTLTRTLFWRDNDRALIGMYVQHSDNLNYGFELASSYGPSGSLTYRRKFSGTWEVPQVVLTKSNYNNYSPTLTGIGASGTWAINISGVAASASKVANALTIQLNGGTTAGTNKFVYDGSSAYTINITPAAIGASATSHTHSYLPLSGGTLGSSTASFTELFIKSSTANMRLMAYSDSTNYIQSGNSAFDGNATLKITGYSNTTGNNLYLKFTNIYCRGNDYTNIDSGNYSSYALPLSGGTMTGTINCKAIVPITDNGYSIGTSSKTLYEIHANFFKRRGSSNSYVLLGGGDHKLISDFVLNYTAVVPGGSVGNNDSWTLILNNNYSTGWYNPCTMFYIRSHNFGCGILCFYHYWDTSLTSGYYDNSVWFFGAEHSAYSGTMGGTGRDINNFLKVYIDKDNDNLKIYYNRYNNQSMEILELLFSLYLAGTLYPKGLIRASHFITNGAVTDLPITSSTFVNIPILTTKNHTEDIKTTRSVYASAFYENSDIRLKENVHSIDLVDLLKNVDLVLFNFKNNLNKKYGVIAQQLEQAGLNNLVYEHNGNKAVDYISLLVLEIQRLRNEIGELKLEINKKS